MTANILLMSFKTVQIFIFSVLSMHVFGSLWLLSDSLTDFEASGYRGGFFFFPPRHRWAVWVNKPIPDAERLGFRGWWMGLLQNVIQLSLSIAAFPSMYKGGGKMQSWLLPSRYLQMKEFLSPVFRTWPLWTGSSSHEHPLKPFVCSPSNGRHLTPN